MAQRTTKDFFFNARGTMNQKERQHLHPVPLPHPGKMLIIEPLDYPNPYDFHHLHRHDYFEIMLVKSGQGRQLIDFSHYDMEANQLFTVYPGQVHLMTRNSADGLLIQFRKDVFEFTHPLKHYHLYFHHPAFQVSPSAFHHLYHITEQMKELLDRANLSTMAIHKAYNYLQILLISLLELYDKQQHFGSQHIVSEFLSLLTLHIREKKKVGEYCTLLGCTTEKLNKECKDALGKSALELIHEEQLLEIRRLLLLGKLSLKEIAYTLNFDSPANFSGFIKAKTGQTPSDLQQSILKIYN